MRFLLLAYVNEQQVGSMSAAELEAFGNECMASDEALRRSGNLISVEGLQGSSTATTVRLDQGKPSITDGPYAETKEQIIGLFVVEARDRDEAVAVALRMPQLRGGPIEVRPVFQIDDGGAQSEQSP